ncbi:hypothetical protein TRIP_D310043 [uncultured Paludibacter sp.]|uniref:DUF4097 domain-containing protein n=1 Tax=uncultured Paludibacter sp. TaxID=497635 RepID=A0A653AC58_9BACT|nr:hypothetical protein TRIP_D310043 [uncultured Paludibacter sp.]
MKKSNIILILLASFIIASILIFYINGKTHEGKIEMNAKNNFKVVNIADFTTLVANDGSDIHFIKSDTAKLKIELDDKKSLSKQLFEVKNDTLYVYKGARMFAYGNNLKSVVSKKAYWIGIHAYNTDSLKMNLQDGEVYINYGEGSTSTYKYIEIQSKDSAKIRITGNVSVEKMVLNTNSTNIQLYNGSFQTIVGMLENHSKLQCMSVMNTINNLQIKKDSTSRMGY